MTSKVSSLIPVLLACFAVAAACGAGCIAQETPGEPAPAPEFHQMAECYDDRIVFSILPYSDTPATYVADYQILRNGTTVEANDGVVYENISASTPIVFEVPRSPNDSVSLKTEIRNTDGEVLDNSTTTIAPVPDATGG
jgi:hypothetical protein